MSTHTPPTLTETMKITATIVEAFKYWQALPQLSDLSSPQKVRDLCRDAGSHYFDADTLRFFGSRNFHFATPGISVECQTNAPEGVGRYSVVAWVIDNDDKRGLEPNKLAAVGTLEAARKLARRANIIWEYPELQVAWTLTRDGLDPAEATRAAFAALR